MEIEIDELFGLPAHPLLVHVPVVLIPLALLAALLALWPAVRRPALVATAVLAVVGAVGAVLAVGAGDKLQDRVRETERVEEHAEQGERVELPAIAFGVAALGAAIALEVAHRSSPLRTGSNGPAMPSGDATTDAAAVGVSGGPGGAVSTAPGTVATVVRAPAAPDTSAAATPGAARWAIGLLALSILIGGYSTYTVIRAGHSGASATWHDTRDAAPSSDADGD
jgi:predicted membrane protein DUF2231